MLFTAEDYEEETGEAGPVEFVPCVDEAEMLTEFWEWPALRRHRHVQRPRLRRALSLSPLGLAERPGHAQGLARLPLSRPSPIATWLEQLTFYGVSGRDGAARRFNLDFYCKAFGIESPKSHGVTGMDVDRLVAEGRFREIAEYCLRDVKATVLLYQIWKERLAESSKPMIRDPRLRLAGPVATRRRLADYEAGRIAACLFSPSTRRPRRSGNSPHACPGVEVLVTGMGKRNAERSLRSFLEARAAGSRLELRLRGRFGPGADGGHGGLRRR